MAGHLPQPPSTDERLNAADQPIPRFALPFPSFAARLSYLARTHAPISLKIAAAELLGRLDRWRAPNELAEARIVTEAIVAGTPLASQVEAVARRRLVEERVREAAFWRSRWDRDKVRNLAALQAALGETRGLILSFSHMGSFHGTFAPVWTDAHRLTYVVTDTWFLEPPDDSGWGLRVEHWRRGLAGIGGRIVTRPGTFDTLHALLERGDVVMLAFDMPGSMKMQFLGKEIQLASGAATIALQTGVPILPVRRARRGLRLEVEYGFPIDPRQHQDAQSLQAALAAQHERWILERPAALEDPRRPGAWEDGAQKTGWSRPERGES